MPGSREVASRLQIFAAALIFSSGGIAIKLTSLSAWQVAGLRSGLAALLLASLGPAWRTGWRPRTLLVAVPFGAVMVLFVASSKLTTASNAIFLQATSLLWVMALAPLLLGEHVRRTDWGFGGLVAAALGLLLLGTEMPSHTAPDPLTGNGLGVAAGLCWGLTLVGLRWLAREGSGETAEGAIVAGNAFAFLFCLPFAFPFGPVAAADTLTVAYLGFVQIGLAYVLLTRGVRHLAAIEVALLLLLEPVLTTLWAWLLLAERPGPTALAGCALVAGATLGRTLLDARRR